MAAPDEFRDQVLSNPSSEFCGLLVGEVVHQPFDQGSREGYEAELLRVDIPLYEPPDRFVYEEVHADSLPVPELPEELVDVALDTNRPGNTAARRQRDNLADGEPVDC